MIPGEDVGVAVAGVVTEIGPGRIEREEWRVTGKPGGGFPPYSFTFGNPYEGDRTGSPEERARAFVALVGTAGARWEEGPFLERRTIIESDWEPA